MNDFIWNQRSRHAHTNSMFTFQGFSFNTNKTKCRLYKELWRKLKMVAKWDIWWENLDSKKHYTWNIKHQSMQTTLNTVQWCVTCANFFFFLVCAKHYYLVTRGVDLGQQIMLDVKTDLKWASQSKNYIHIKTHNVRKFLTITRPQDMRPDVFQIFLHTCWEQKWLVNEHHSLSGSAYQSLVKTLCYFLQMLMKIVKKTADNWFFFFLKSKKW